MNQEQINMVNKRIDQLSKSIAEIDTAIQTRNLDGPTLRDIQQDRRDYNAELSLLKAKIAEMEGSHE